MRQNTQAKDTRIAVLIMSAGKGLRAGLLGDVPKQYRMLAGKSVIARSIMAFAAPCGVDMIQPVIAAGDEGSLATAMTGFLPPAGSARITMAVHGGATRQASVLCGLEALAAQGFGGLVMVHDAARPFVSAGLIARAIEAGTRLPAAIPVMPLTDTVKTTDAAGTLTGTLPRAGLVSVQTPQVFDFPILLNAHRKAAAAGIDSFTDDAAVMEWLGVPVASFAGEASNIKLTTQEDFAIAAARLAAQLVTRVGQGYDVHRFCEGDHVWIGGVRIAHDRGVEAHSDGDVVLHALTDAILGALADGDIGVHFSPHDPQWRGAASDQFLAFAAARLRERGGMIDHLDTTLVCEEPRVGPHREAIRARIAAICEVAIGQVSIKATTSERMGFTGRREGLSASAVVTLRLPAGAA